MQKLKLTEVRKTLNFEIQRGSTSHYLYKLADGAYNITIDYDVFLPSKGKNLQRPFCWNGHQKQELIISVLKGIKLPPIAIIIHTDEGTQKTIYKIIDGKQRLSTLIDFYRGDFPISWNGEIYFYNNLDEDAQGAIRLLTLSTDRVYEYPDAMISDDDKIAWFEMINFAGSAQDIEHLNNLKMTNRKA